MRHVFCPQVVGLLNCAVFWQCQHLLNRGLPSGDRIVRQPLRTSKAPEFPHNDIVALLLHGWQVGEQVQTLR
jgi:hypothetical protein